MRLSGIVVIAACLLLPSVSFGEQRPRVWLRRITLAASCAASAWDVQTTSSAIGRGGRESNNMFTDPLGQVRWGRMIGFKAVLCGGMAAVQEIKPLANGRLWGREAVKDDLWIGINTGITARFVFSSIRNRSVTASRP